MSLVPVDASSAVAVTDYLTKARDWLSTAVESSTPVEIAGAKAELSVAAEATKQLGLSQEIRDDASEMVRRAEYALGKSIRKGQAEGTVRQHGERDATYNPSTHQFMQHEKSKASPREFATRGELYGARGAAGILAIADRIDAADLDSVISQAKSEGNLSRANVARIADERAGKPAPVVEPNVRAEQEADLINAVASVLRPLTTKNVNTLSPKTRTRLLRVLEIATRNLKGETE